MYLQMGGDRLLHVGVCCKYLPSQMLLKVSKEMKITGREFGTVERMGHKPLSIAL
jgi:hypothetical protein